MRNHKATALSFHVLTCYKRDYHGIPREADGFSRQHDLDRPIRAVGQVVEQRSEGARKHGVMNPIRFRRQYHELETGLRYNRYRYYDPGAAIY